MFNGRMGVVAFAFGRPETVKSNQRLAEMASVRAVDCKGPVFTQRDIVANKRFNVKDVEQVYEPGEPPPTLRIAREAVKWAERRDLNFLWVVAAKPHLWRCLRDLRAACKEARKDIRIESCPEIEHTWERDWFCPNSTQARSRSPWKWYQRELILKAMPFFIYKRIAS